MYKTSLNTLKDLLAVMQPADYACPCVHLNNSSIGEHVRHALEMYVCLADSYASGKVDYSLRRRDKLMETDPTIAIQTIGIVEKLQAVPHLPLQVIVNDAAFISSFGRELYYCDEHLVHHLALIRAGLLELGKYEVPSHFGVAPSTLQYQDTCAQ